MNSSLLPAKAGQSKSKELTVLQKSVCDLHLGDNTLTVPEIAEKAGCPANTVWVILKKQHVREYILSNVNSKLLLTADQALSTQSKLLTSKSDYVRHQAASDLLNRSEVGSSGMVIGQAVKVEIDLS